jgi:hypothetical protein
MLPATTKMQLNVMKASESLVDATNLFNLIVEVLRREPRPPARRRQDCCGRAKGKVN